jgi:hypothetical protein
MIEVCTGGARRQSQETILSFQNVRNNRNVQRSEKAFQPVGFFQPLTEPLEGKQGDFSRLFFGRLKALTSSDIYT